MICVCTAVFVWVFLCFVMWLWLCVVDGCVVYVGECGYGSIGGPDPELGTGEGNKGLIELAGIRCGTHFPFSFLMLLVLGSWEGRENIRGESNACISSEPDIDRLPTIFLCINNESCERKKHNV